MKKTECKRCCGTGKVGNFAHVKGGVCFSCNGTGIKRVTKLVEVQRQYGVVVYPCGNKGGEMSVSCARMVADKIAGATVEIITKTRKERV